VLIFDRFIDYLYSMMSTYAEPPFNVITTCPCLPACLPALIGPFAETQKRKK